MKKIALVMLLGFSFFSCKPFDYPWFKPAENPGVFIQHLSTTGEFAYKLDLGLGAKSVLFTFTNSSELREAPALPTVNGAVVGGESRTGIVPPFPDNKAVHRAEVLGRIAEFNRDAFTLLPGGKKGFLQQNLVPPPPPNPDDVGNSDTFWDPNASQVFVSVPAHCQKVVSLIDIGDATRTLNIWVADDCWYSTGSGKAYYMNETMVAALADKFLETGSFNDIYDWTTALIGSEWGAHPYPTLLIPPNDEITILLCDIEGDNQPDGGVVGYFWAKDNFVRVLGDPILEYSQGRIMFYIDAVMYAHPDGTWDASDYWPEEVYSTLAHEFQHMINFYQKQIVFDAQAGTEVWINEMCSQIVEDLLAAKLQVIGPRGVEGTDGTAGAAGNEQGRLPWFNYYDYVSLTDWGGSGPLPSYSSTYAFGAYLARNYGGAALLRDIVRCPEFDSASVVNAVSAFTGRQESLQKLLERWSAAIVLSDLTGAPTGYRFNIGFFFASSIGGADYDLGSIDFFNYRFGTLDGPRLYTGRGPVGSTRPLPTSNTYYLAGTSLESEQEWVLDVPAGVTLSVIVK